MFSACCIFCCGVFQLCFFFLSFCFSPQIAFCCSHYCILFMTLILPFCMLFWWSFFFHWINKILLSTCSCLFFCFWYIYIVILRYSNWLWQFCELPACLWGSFSSLFLCCFWLMLCLIVMAGFKVGGGEAVLAKDQSGTSWEGISH